LDGTAEKMRRRRERRRGNYSITFAWGHRQHENTTQKLSDSFR
jgi:hypothetical protein